MKLGGWCVDEAGVMFSGEDSWPSDFQIGTSVANREHMWLGNTAVFLPLVNLFFFFFENSVVLPP